ncbi:MAG: pyridoxal-phosphate dependent enzyme [Melioribacteraceae bacterium]|nr:pyridoxal-phosphate dependent enzyme [Melioribacteraceae bacterium]MCF8356796.1 pyridoxal-phosphate dependent enzyme [Melioribacteraceae bacterium]MCF8396176.1 pyridoxal-phosphate dependent enzyme [Melioribacteraceae bacterium]MCF8421127.1 pyridoxal-phosphate dependent enzyme [Melioribacteraceae bacterium]
MSGIPSKDEIISAHERIKNHIHRTPVLTSKQLNEIYGCSLYFKCENMQKVGAFKFRGAANSVLSLDDSELTKGVATHSSGNHAAALALAAKSANVKAYIVMPRTAPSIKKKAVEGYGAEIIYCEPTLQAREETLNEVIAETGAAFIHPYNNYAVIAGQSTAAKEIYEVIPDLDYLITPVGGGGLLSGSSLSTKYFSPGTKVIGAEPEGADDAYRSFRDAKIYPSINPDTICDGLLTSLCEKTFEIITRNVSEIITVDDSNIIAAMRNIWERMKIIVEPSAAVTLAVIGNNKEKFAGKKAALILSGGNVDLDNLPWSKLER